MIISALTAPRRQTPRPLELAEVQQCSVQPGTDGGPSRELGWPEGNGRAAASEDSGWDGASDRRRWVGFGGASENNAAHRPPAGMNAASRFGQGGAPGASGPQGTVRLMYGCPRACELYTSIKLGSMF